MPRVKRIARDKLDEMLRKPSSIYTNEELANILLDLRHYVKQDVKEVAAAAVASSTIPTDAIKALKEFEKDILFQKVRNQPDRKKLERWYRQISYIRNLKSSTVEGAQKMSFGFTPFKNVLSSLPQDYRDEFWRVYNNYYNISQGTGEAFKYELFTEQFVNFVVENLDAGFDSSEISTMLVKAQAVAGIATAAEEAAAAERQQKWGSQEVMDIFGEQLSDLMLDRSRYMEEHKNVIIPKFKPTRKRRKK